MISIIVPAYNEEKRIKETLQRIYAYFDSKNIVCEVIVVDDGSSDQTADIVQRVSDRIILVQNKPNRGKGYSVKRGIEHAQYDSILLCDADLATPIEEYEKLAPALENGHDVVVASRRITDADVRTKQPLHRRLLGAIFSYTTRTFFSLPIYDTQCGFKLFRAAPIKHVCQKQTIDRFSFDVEILYIAKKLGYGIKEVPVAWYDKEGSTVNMRKDAPRMLLDLGKILFNSARKKYKDKEHSVKKACSLWSWKSALIAFLALLWIPYFFHPFAINLYPDTAIELYDVIAFHDKTFAFDISYDGLQNNVVTSLFKMGHGAIRPLILYPLFFGIDLVGIPITDVSVAGVYVAIAIVLTIIQYSFLKKIIGRASSLMVSLLLLTIPWYVILAKSGSWQIFHICLNVVSLYYLWNFLKEKKRKDYALFCLFATLYLLANPGFIFGFVHFALIAFVFFAHNATIKQVALRIKEFLWSRWTLLPVATIGGLLGAAYVAHLKFGVDFGVMSKIFAKADDGLRMYGPDTVLFFFASELGLTGFAVFPAMLIGALWLLVQNLRKKHVDALHLGSAIFFILGLGVFLLVGKNGPTYIDNIYIAGLLCVAYVLRHMSIKKIAIALFILIFGFNYAQTLLYNFEYTPQNVLSKELSIYDFPDGYQDACSALWCPYHFGYARNVGIKTLGFVLRDYLAVSPVEYGSRTSFFDDRPKEVFFPSFGQGPTIHLGRRITYKLHQFDNPDIVALFTPYTLEQYPELGTIALRQEVLSRLSAEHTLVARITKEGNDVIEVYQKNPQRPLEDFPVEIYDVLFDARYANLEDMSYQYP